MSSTKLSEVGTSPVERGARPRIPRTLIGLCVVLGLLAIGAAQGGVAMIADPDTPLGMTADYLDGTPVTSYLLPGWFLLGIATASSLTLAGIIFDWRWGWAAGIERSIGHRWPWLGSILTGGVLLAFEIVELFTVPFHPVMHPLLIAVSLALIGLPSTRSGRAFLRTRR